MGSERVASVPRDLPTLVLLHFRRIKAVPGMQNKMIASQFSLSEHTVKIHLHNIISKLARSNRTEAAARFRDYKAAAG